MPWRYLPICIMALMLACADKDSPTQSAGPAAKLTASAVQVAPQPNNRLTFLRHPTCADSLANGLDCDPAATQADTMIGAMSDTVVVDTANVDSVKTDTTSVDTTRETRSSAFEISESSYDYAPHFRLNLMRRWWWLENFKEIVISHASIEDRPRDFIKVEFEYDAISDPEMVSDYEGTDKVAILFTPEQIAVYDYGRVILELASNPPEGYREGYLSIRFWADGEGAGR